MNPLVKINCIELTWIESKEKLDEWENLLIESDFPILTKPWDGKPLFEKS